MAKAAITISSNSNIGAELPTHTVRLLAVWLKYLFAMKIKTIVKLSLRDAYIFIRNRYVCANS